MSNTYEQDALANVMDGAAPEGLVYAVLALVELQREAVEAQREATAFAKEQLVTMAEQQTQFLADMREALSKQ